MAQKSDFWNPPCVESKIDSRFVTNEIKSQACMIDFMFAVSTFTNQKELLQSTQKGGAKNDLQKDLEAVAANGAALGLYNCSLENFFLFFACKTLRVILETPVTYWI